MARVTKEKALFQYVRPQIDRYIEVASIMNCFESLFFCSMYSCMMLYSCFDVDLLSRMSVEQKISQLGNSAASVDNLTVPAYQW